MAMKGHSGGNGNGNRGRQYGLILFLAFGAAIFGVMVLHKLRERRIFNLLVQEKENQLLSLQIILQKERDYNKEANRRTGEMKAKIYTLGTEKMELERKLLEMQSMISSVKDEQKLMESTIREKLNEIKLLREKKAEPIMENPQVVALTESLKQKETEIEDLKQRLQNPVEVKNETLHDSTTDREFEDSSKNAGESLKEPITYQDVDGAKGAEAGDMKDETGVDIKKAEDSVEVEVGRTNANETSDSVVNQIGVMENNGKEDEVLGDLEREKDDLKGQESEQLERHTRGGMKLEMPYKSQVQGHTSSTSQEKKWRILARNRKRSSNLLGENLKDRQYHGRYKRLRNDELQKLEKQQRNHSKGLGVREESGHVNDNVEVNNKHQQGGDLKIAEEDRVTRKAAELEDNGGVAHETNEKSNLTVDGEANETSEQKAGENRQNEEQTDGVQEETETRDGEKVDQNLEEEKVDDKYEESEESVVETKTVEGNRRGSEAKLDEEQEVSEEETEEPEF